MVIRKATTPSPTALLALNNAMSNLGVKEVPSGSNDGPKVRVWLAGVGLPAGYAWCMAFVYAMFSDACMELGISNPLQATGGVLHQFNTCSGKGIYKMDARIAPITIQDLLSGDIFIIQFRHGQGHTGIVKKITGKSFLSIEGNTNIGGEREGIGVFERRRFPTELRGIIRITI